MQLNDGTVIPLFRLHEKENQILHVWLFVLYMYTVTRFLKLKINK